MRRTFLFLVSLIAILGLLAPAANAQPTPKVTINGLIDMVTSWSRNMSHAPDLNYEDDRDNEWYARSRLRPDITAEVGTTKFVLGLEIDYAFGQVGAADSGAGQRFGTSFGADLNTDTASVIEVKWGYLEFEMPWAPGSRVRLGAQPFATTYKLALASGDFAGAHFTWAPIPNLRLNFTYAQIEEQSIGASFGFVRGEDKAIITSVEITPIKGLDLRPIYAYANIDGPTNGSTRQARGGLSLAAHPRGLWEDRHTVGLDARWKMGPFSLDPTVFFQFGERETTVGDQDLRAWFVDIRGGWQAGPLLLEVAGIYTTGNKADERIDTSDEDVNFFQPINTDTGYYAGWANIYALGIDYFNILYAGAAGLNPGVAIGYDKYGLIRAGARATYALTPALSVYTNITASWTAEKVDTSSTLLNGLTPGDASGDKRYLGTEVDIGLTWRFAPNVTFDLVGGWLFAGKALENATNPGNPEDVKTVAARVRYTF